MAYRNDRCVTRSVPPYRRMLAHVTPSRDQASVYFKQTIDVTRSLEWIDDFNRRTGKKMSLLILVMTAIGRVINANPRINRYVSGWNFYERDGVTISVSAKKALVDGARIVLLKVPVLPNDMPEAVLDRFQAMLKEGRENPEIAQEKEHRLFLYLPDFVLHWIVRLALWLERRHWLPAALVDPDPLYTTLVLANLGSVGLDAAYHHLYEWGTATYFAVIGRISERPISVGGNVEIRKVVEIKYTFDERVEDGLATGLGLAGIQELLEDPETWVTGTTDLGGRPPEHVSI